MSQETQSDSLIKDPQIDDYLQAARGQVEIHAWRSRSFPGLLMRAVRVELGADLAETDRQWPAADDPAFRGIIDAYSPYYDGPITMLEAEAKYLSAINATPVA